uniref:phosphatidyl-N-methylethanolamine N-methyltransferase n=1 Tax=Chlamydomonas asymmetrica TaxID=51683 RepID=A0A2Z5X872_9CHLO|nr:phospholipid-N-methyltransferase [Chlamydomonas asymmetrica]
MPTMEFCRQLDAVPQELAMRLLFPLLALPHFLYAFIWFNPKAWTSMFGKRSVGAFAVCGALGKVIQFGAVVLWLWSARASGLCFDLKQISLPQFLGAVLLGAFGQQLNIGIFKAIGTAGVYYGFKLGAKVPWVEGYPFNVVPHPQYVGSVATIWAAAILVLGQLPHGWWVVPAFWMCLYIVSAVQEDNL